MNDIPMKENPKATVHGPEDGTWISWLGSPAQFLAIGTETDGTYCLSRAESAPGGGAPPHTHDFEEGFFILRGGITCVAGNRSFDLAPGQFLNVGSNVAHELMNHGSEPAEMLIFAAPAGFDRFQMQGGTIVEDSKGPFLPPGAEDHVRIREAAARHGVELSPPPSAFNEPGRVTFRGEEEGLIIDTVGDRYRFLVTGEETGGKYALWEALIGPNGGPPPHVHSREVEGFYVLDGELTFYTEERSFAAGPGTLVNLPRNSLHWFRNETDTTVRALIFVAPAGFEQMFLETGTRVGSWSDALSPPDEEEKSRILEVAPRYGVEIRRPTKDR